MGFVDLVMRIISGELARPVNVILSTEDGSATSTAPVDYINPGDTTLQFDSVADAQFARITITNDDIYENQENLFSNLISLDGSVIINPGSAEVLINEDNDGTFVALSFNCHIVSYQHRHVSIGMAQTHFGNTILAHKMFSSLLVLIMYILCV